MWKMDLCWRWQIGAGEFKLEYLYSFRNNEFKLSLNSNFVRIGSLLVNDNMSMLDMVAFYSESFNNKSSSTKHKIYHTNSRVLWHMLLGHICKNRVEWLVSNGILDSIDSTFVC